MITSIVLIVVGARGRRVPDTTTSSGIGSDPHGGPLGPPSPETAVHLDDDVRTPVGVS